MKKLKFAIVGCGRISYKHVEALANNRDEAELVATCDVVLEKAETKKAEYIEKTGAEENSEIHGNHLHFCHPRSGGSLEHV